MLMMAFVFAGCGEPEVKPLSHATPDPNGPLMPVLGSRSAVETTTDSTAEIRRHSNELEK